MTASRICTAIRYAIITTLLRVGAVLFVAACATAPPSLEPRLAITNVTVIDGSGAPAKSAATVIVRGRVIEAVGRARVPRGARVIDGRGKFLIPGLWDMHVHALRPDRIDAFFPLFIANGVTGIRDMGTPLAEFEQLPRVRAEIAARTRIGPRIVAAGPPLDGAKQRRPDLSLSIKSPDDGRAAVRMLSERGADFIKVVNLIGADAYGAVVDEAKKRNLVVAGHIPWAISAWDVSNAGQRSIEHLGSAYVGVLLSCSREEEDIRREIIAAIEVPGSTPASVLPTHRALSARTLATFDESKAKRLIETFERNGTWQVPTLVLLRSFALGTETAFVTDPRLEYMPPGIRANWPPEKNPFYNGITPEQLAHGRALFAKQLEIVRAMHRGGVKVLAGSDTPNPFVYPGFSLHDELALLVQAGMTPMEALQSATKHVADFLGTGANAGTIETGKVADMVILSANPLDSIENTRLIAGVIADGRYFSNEELEEMKARARTAASR